MDLSVVFDEARRQQQAKRTPDSHPMLVEAQAHELRLRFASAQRPEEPPLQPGDIVVEKHGVGVFSADNTVFILWRLMDENSYQDRVIMRNWHEVKYATTLDCLVGYISMGEPFVGATIMLFPHSLCMLKRWSGE